MLKKICLFTFSLLVSVPTFGIDITDLQNQRNHIVSEMRSIKRTWNVDRIHIKMAQKASLVAYQAIRPVIEKIIASNDFVTKMDGIVANQVDAIVNRNMSFASVKTEISLMDLFPNAAVNAFGQKFFSAMADKACMFLLGQKLAQKVQELDIAIKMMQQAPPSTMSSTTTSPWW